MSERYDSTMPFGGRVEYSKPEAEMALERDIIIDHLDELLVRAQDSGSEYRGRLQNSRDAMTHERFFEYMEAGGVDGWAWPLVEKGIDISYSRTKRPFLAEQYRITVATTIQQAGVSPEPILNTYEIYRCGNDGYMNISEPDIVGQSEWNYTTRSATSYDHEQLLLELKKLDEMLDAQEQENSHQVL